MSDDYTWVPSPDYIEGANLTGFVTALGCRDEDELLAADSIPNLSHN